MNRRETDQTDMRGVCFSQFTKGHICYLRGECLTGIIYDRVDQIYLATVLRKLCTLSSNSLLAYVADESV